MTISELPTRCGPAMSLPCDSLATRTMLWTRHSKETGESATRGGRTRRDGAFLIPASSNSSPQVSRAEAFTALRSSYLEKNKNLWRVYRIWNSRGHIPNEFISVNAIDNGILLTPFINRLMADETNYVSFDWRDRLRIHTEWSEDQRTHW
jgi:hypothetical protein